MPPSGQSENEQCSIKQLSLSMCTAEDQFPACVAWDETRSSWRTPLYHFPLWFWFCDWKAGALVTMLYGARPMIVPVSGNKPWKDKEMGLPHLLGTCVSLIRDEGSPYSDFWFLWIPVFAACFCYHRNAWSPSTWEKEENGTSKFVVLHFPATLIAVTYIISRFYSYIWWNRKGGVYFLPLIQTGAHWACFSVEIMKRQKYSGFVKSEGCTIWRPSKQRKTSYEYDT